MSGKPRLLDLFCGAGGCTRGYQNAGWYVKGLDNRAQPRYCGDEFEQADFLTDFWRIVEEFQPHAIHASPPCQAWSRATAWSGDRSKHPRLIEPTRDLLRATGLPYVIENVQEARHELREPIMLCGSQFAVPVRSHRYFEIHPTVFDLMPPCVHRPSDASRDHGSKQTESVFRDALGCEWMTVYEAREAIPPAMTEWIGHQLMQHLKAQAA